MASPLTRRSVPRPLAAIPTSARHLGALTGDAVFRRLFANLQSPGITLAITGSWRRGSL